MSKRDRAFSAILKDGMIVMVRVVDGERDFWTLPGGGAESNERLEEAAIREAKEEVNLDIRIVRFLFNREYKNGTEYCYLAELINEGVTVPTLGFDPEFDMDKQVLVETQWKRIENLKEDLHVSQVLKTLTSQELKQYNLEHIYENGIQ